ncbi:MAG: hypothetical protein COA65_09060 [Rhodospirillaceae bacterium]|nr:MAG: hypothetical protein COA65_09060 [Rhodospirillaceae bacterium]
MAGRLFLACTKALPSGQSKSLRPWMKAMRTKAMPKLFLLLLAGQTARAIAEEAGQLVAIRLLKQLGGRL